MIASAGCAFYIERLVMRNGIKALVHADRISARPRLHGLQVGMATYIVSRLQGGQTDTIRSLFEGCGFFDAIRNDPFSKSEWLEAARLAPAIKEGFYTVLSSRDCVDEIGTMLENDASLAGCFIA